jgi:hypothetical protein
MRRYAWKGLGFNLTEFNFLFDNTPCHKHSLQKCNELLFHKSRDHFVIPIIDHGKLVNDVYLMCYKASCRTEQLNAFNIFSQSKIRNNVLFNLETFLAINTRGKALTVVLENQNLSKTKTDMSFSLRCFSRNNAFPLLVTFKT